MQPKRGATLTDSPDPRDEALARLAEAQRARLLGIARRVLGDHQEAEDVVQEALTRLLLRDLPPDSPPAWLTAVTYRLALDRKGRLARRRAGAALDSAPARGPDPAEAAATRELAVAAQAALERLPEPYRSALRLRYREGLSFGEIAARLEAPERTTRTWVGRGLVRLRALLGRRFA